MIVWILNQIVPSSWSCDALSFVFRCVAGEKHFKPRGALASTDAAHQLELVNLS